MPLNQDELSKALGTNDQTNDQTTQPTQTDDIKIKLGDKEYTQEELNNAIGFKSQVEESQRRYNTTYDKVWSEYGRSQTRVKELEDEIKRVREQPKIEVPMDQQVQIAEAKKAAKQLGILTRDDLTELGIVTKADFEQSYRLQRATEKLVDAAKDLEGKIDGKDGRPAFKTEEIFQYMNDTGVRDPELAYKMRFERELDSWKETKLASAKKGGVNTMEPSMIPGTNKQPRDVKITRDNMKALLGEALEGKF